ncbi:MAG TPA: glutaredoxin family protein [Methylotenera sp.]|nr:glutaredoxin family protein [Methylotenera sp.]HPH06673.1 glutaredoxin family protein [Methylotenera sp.]HPN01684.1 glutaredoxin family protein [Methylotenera sp.]
MQLYLYSTTHCHLCEKAENLLQPVCSKLDLTWQSVEISDDSQLLNLYETKIPVLKRTDTNEELLWPFDAQQIATFLR